MNVTISNSCKISLYNAAAIEKVYTIVNDIKIVDNGILIYDISLRPYVDAISFHFILNGQRERRYVKSDVSIIKQLYKHNPKLIREYIIKAKINISTDYELMALILGGNGNDVKI